MEFEPADVIFWFSQLEAEMLMASVGSQWLKKTILQRVKSDHVFKEEYVIKAKADAGDHIYLDIKERLIAIYAPKPSDSYRRALSRTMVGLPSQLGNQIINDICKKPTKLSGCCGAGAAHAIWSIQLPINVRGQISNMPFTLDAYRQVFEAADSCFLSSKQIQVAAVGQGATSELDETLPAFQSQNQPVQVTAVTNRGRGGSRARGGRGRGNRGGRGAANEGGNGGGSQQGQARQRGPRHSSMPPDSCCDRHY